MQTIRRQATTVAAIAVLLSSTALTLPAAAAEPGSITGVVLAADTGSGLAGVNVSVETMDGLSAGWAVTDASGTYSTGALDAGEYRVFFDTQNNISAPRKYVSEWYPNLQFRTTAPPVTVAAGEALIIDRTLAVGGSIEGAVTAANGAPTSTLATVWAWDDDAVKWVVQARVGGQVGSYKAEGLRAGTYRVGFRGSYATNGTVTEYYNNSPTLHYSTNVTVALGQTTTGIDVTFGTRQMASDRIAGSNRYETAAMLAEGLHGQTLFIANGENFPDALSAAPAAATMGSPLLLTKPGSLPPSTAVAIRAFYPSEIVIMGNSASVSDSVVAAIQAVQPSATIRRIEGKDRYETSRKLVRFLFERGHYDLVHGETFIATGASFPDALSVAPLAGSRRSPLILVPGGASTLDSETKELIAELGNEGVRVIGGRPSVSEAIRLEIDALPEVEFAHREHGANRYETSRYVNWYFEAPIDKAYLAVGTSFADALAGGARAGIEGVPLYLVQTNCVPLPTKGDLFDVSVQEVVLLGGTPSLSPAVESLTTC